MRNKGKYAQAIHITPEKGLLNDPNGLCYFDGYYHVFYQYNPYITDHSTKYWGHVRSKDMQTWEQLPLSLKSNDWFDKDGVYSGSAIVHNGTMYLFYTGNTKDENGVRTSYQCLATSKEGIHFEKHGPILEQVDGFTGHVRDPKVWRDEKLNGWWMIIGAQRLDKTGDTIAYFSKDLFNWEYRGSILQFDEPLGFMWECPDLIFLTDEVTEEKKAVFIFSPQGLEPVGNAYHNIFNTTYIVGRWDNQTAKFILDQASKLSEIDHGFEFYAPQTFIAPDGRTIQYAWMGTMWPEVEQAVPTHVDNWIHHLSMPKSLHLVEGLLVQRPLIESIDLVKEKFSDAWVGNQEFTLSEPTRIKIETVSDVNGQWELQVDNELKITYASKVLVVSRTNWLTHEREERKWEIFEGVTSIDLWIDASSVEVFINDGKYVFSQRFFAHDPLSKLVSKVNNGISGTLEISSLSGYRFK